MRVRSLVVATLVALHVAALVVIISETLAVCANCWATAPLTSPLAGLYLLLAQEVGHNY